MTLIPGVIAILAVICIRFYPLSDQDQEKIHDELNNKNSKNNEVNLGNING